MDVYLALLVIGALLLLGLLADAVGRRTRVPRVTLLILLGVLIGNPGLGLLPAELAHWHEFLATAALTMVAFVLGGGLTARTLRSHGREIIALSMAVVAASVLLVVLGLVAIGVPAPLALILGGIATATAPAATRDVVKQSGMTGAFSERLLGIVAIDDAWGLIVFGVLLVVAKSVIGEEATDVVQLIGVELGGSLLVGAVIGIPAAYLTGRLRPGEPMQIEALGVVFLCAGLAVWLDVSFLLAGMIAGAVVSNMARHHDRPFHEIENVQGPFLILFFVLAGASLEIPLLGELGMLCAAYVLLRIAGRLVGGLLGGAMAGLPMREGLWTGAALTPQAGVALGMALVAGDHFPEMRETILSLTIASTVFFEVTGPILTQRALERA